jgi:ribonucleoside-diphosphate reductase alpha chain
VVTDELSQAALHLLETRYLRRDDRGLVVESFEELLWRVAESIAAGDRQYGTGEQVSAVAYAFHSAMAQRRFLPNTPTLINAGTDLNQLLACFVLPVPDSLDGIFNALHDAAFIQQGGGGTGYSFSDLRPRGDIVHSTRRPSSGPVSFLRIFDVMSEVISGESVRGGANMAVLRVDHPDIREFASAKAEAGALRHFNLSVAVDDSFMRAVSSDGELSLVNPRDGHVSECVSARSILSQIVEHARDHGDPGMLYLDRVERDNPTPGLGPLQATNPCGEVPLLPYEACCLGSINLVEHLFERDGRAILDEERLVTTARLGVHFLDNVLEVTRHPLKQTEEISRGNRKIGLGVMGLADVLMRLGIPYGSDESIQFVERIMGLIQRTAVDESRRLAVERGPFPNFPVSRYAAAGEVPRRNATVTTVAPTGGISLLAGCSSGVEPLYALAYERGGEVRQRLGPHPEMLSALQKAGVTDPAVIREIEQTGRMGHIESIPSHIRRLFRVANEIDPREHMSIQAAVQHHVENAVSKTINLPADATYETVWDAFVSAHELGCKGITVYREGSSADQVLHVIGHCLACLGEDQFPLDLHHAPAFPDDDR